MAAQALQLSIRAASLAPPLLLLSSVECSALPLAVKSPAEDRRRLLVCRCNSKGASEDVSAAGAAFPRPAEIPWKKEVCNSVQFIGQIGTPVHFKLLASRKAFAWTNLCVKTSATAAFWINLALWDELAHAAFHHVKKGDQVHVLGRLVSYTVEGADQEHKNFIKLQVVVHQLNFVEKKDRPVFSCDSDNSIALSDEKNNDIAEDAVSSTEMLWQAFFANPLDWWDNRKTKRNPKYPDFKHKHTGESLWVKSKYNPQWIESQLTILDSQLESSRANKSTIISHEDFSPF